MRHRGPKNWYGHPFIGRGTWDRGGGKRRMKIRAINIPPDSVLDLEDAYNRALKAKEKFRDRTKSKLLLQLCRNPEENFESIARKFTELYRKPYTGSTISNHLRFLRGLHMGYKYPWAHSNRHWRYRRKSERES